METLSSRPTSQNVPWPPRIVISAPRGRSGKTSVAIGLCAAFAQAGINVQPFKKGPDYIDPSWLTAATGRTCRNLDSFLIPESALLSSFGRATCGTDLAIIEGAMGLYDSISEEGEDSTASLSRLLGAPVILVVDVERMTRSVAALVMGFQRFEPQTNVAGVILNNVAGNRHESKLRTAIAEYCGIPVLGIIPKDENITIPQRHLGIVPRAELENSRTVVDRIRDSIAPRIDLASVLGIARQATALGHVDVTVLPPKPAAARIGIISDSVFDFYYPDNLEALAQEGAELVFIDSLRSPRLPDIDGLYIGGGFPELFLEELEANASLRTDIARAAENGLPIYAECAGLMYLSRSIRWQERAYEMVGVIPADTELSARPQGHGYVIAEVIGENPLFPVGSLIRGHEFHHSRITNLAGARFAYSLRRGRGVNGEADGIVINNVFASYAHLHALGTPAWAERFMALVMREKKSTARRR